MRGRLGRTSETEEEQSDLGVVMGQAIILSEIKTKRSQKCNVSDSSLGGDHLHSQVKLHELPQ